VAGIKRGVALPRTARDEETKGLAVIERTAAKL